jgi:hypothetical protein
MIDTRLHMSTPGTDVHSVGTWIAAAQATVDAASKPVDMSLGDLVTVGAYAALAAPEEAADPMTPAEAQAWLMSHVMANMGPPLHCERTITVASALPSLRALLAMDCPDDLAAMIKSNLP